MCQFVSCIMLFQKIIVYKIPLEGKGDGLWPAQGILTAQYINVLYSILPVPSTEKNDRNIFQYSLNPKVP